VHTAHVPVEIVLINMDNVNDHINDFWKKFDDMRKTPHECDYDYRIDPSGKMFFQICRLCLDTSGVVEMDNE
jgi:hypothetical protein